jgi:hypothetical protein
MKLQIFLSIRCGLKPKKCEFYATFHKNLYEKLVFKSGDPLDMSVFCVKRAL